MSFDIALSGIQAINESLDVTSHNIANAGTYGYKANRANFATLVAGSQLNGVTVGSTTQNIGLSGGILNTGRALDASISGRGFFVTRAADNSLQYTRVGIFDTSLDGYLVDASGRRVQGKTITPPSTEPGAEGDLKIPVGAIPAQITTKATYVGNLSADWAVKTPVSDPTTITPSTPPDPSTYNTFKTTNLYDSLGTQHVLTQYFTMTGSTGGVATVHVSYALDGNGITAGKDLNFDTTNGTLNPDDPTVTPDLTVSTLDLTATNVDTSDPNLWPKFANGANMNGAVTIDYTGTTFFSGETSVASNTPVDGYSAGNFSGVSLGSDGSVIAKYTNGQTQTVGKVVLASFANEGGLTQVSDTSWEASAASGVANTDLAGVGVNGQINVATLEQSNVDITSELVGLMTSQRNYQANSKVIQTESTMLQSLMQAI
ncbi:flagellar hook-basal body complex protein [Pseudoduganella sp. FT25W]|jgi:flagellar hook protein FlgE|uniref:Flagellar hook protein FlgE n=1 Tax=Duganella alba TaxID=2666081 RepID=A0A6L5QH90_9BURK|nr:flagellar hook-basal body complex protein [Duganella alba]MRX09164.1 flagellar hook-basal body complex protein [Duganella alba]MRX15559.1 flagellar hook-basal body complex protein [Duganella alba]